MSRLHICITFAFILTSLATAHDEQGTKRGADDGYMVTKVLRKTHNRIVKNVPKYTHSIYNPEEGPAANKEEKCEVKRPNFCPFTTNKHRALVNDVFKWPGAVVPFEIGNITREAYDTLLRAMKDITDQTCVRFVNRTNEKDYVLFIINKDDYSCWSRLGRWGGMQEISLGRKCGLRKGTLLHEMLHTLGFEHEQSRIDRDKFVRINWENIEDDEYRQFTIANSTCGMMTKTLSSDYSYSSIMHYSEYGFSKNGNKTIEPIQEIDPERVQIGQRLGLDKSDIERIREHYQCSGRQSHWQGNAHATYECQSDILGSLRHAEVVTYNGIVYKYDTSALGTHRVRAGVSVALQLCYPRRTSPWSTCATKNSWCTRLATFTENMNRSMETMPILLAGGTRCKAETNWKKRYVPHACLNGTGHKALVGETYRDGSFMKQCTSDGIINIGCIGDNGEPVDVGKALIYSKRIYICIMKDDTMKFELASKEKLFCVSSSDKLFIHGEKERNGSYVLQCFVDASSGDWEMKRVACSDQSHREVELGRNFVKGKFVYKCYNSSSVGVTSRSIGCAGEGGEPIAPGNRYYKDGKWLDCYTTEYGDLRIRYVPHECLNGTGHNALNGKTDRYYKDGKWLDCYTIEDGKVRIRSSSRPGF